VSAGMSAGSVSPLEHQQLELAGAADMTYWHRVRFELVARHADAVGARRILDVGAGSGLLGAWLRANRPGMPYGFTETSEVLRARLVGRFGQVAEAPPGAPIETATVVTLLDVLEHIDDDAAALAELHGRMAPGSHLVVTVPAGRWAYSGWDEQLGHHRRYSRRSLRAVLERAGFASPTTAHLFPELLPLLVVRRLRRAPVGQVDFPRLPPLVEAAGYRVASLTAAARRVWPAGTSVLATAVRTR
jgi:SAM-dependent methyltransferase